MTLKIRGPRRFDAPTVLKGDTPFLGATVAEWDRAIIGNMGKTLAEVKLRTENAPKRDASKAVTSDLASIVSKRLATSK